MGCVLTGLVTVAGLSDVIFFTEALGEGFAGETCLVMGVAGLADVIFFTEALEEAFAGKTGLVGEAGFCFVVAIAFGWALSSTICFADNLS